jgi:hypothetical protein
LAIFFIQDCSRDEPFFAYVRELSETENVAVCDTSGQLTPISGP